MPNTLDGQRIAILGGGLIGLYSAHYLMQRGAEVVIVEKSVLGSGAARGNGGLVVWTECTPLAGPGVVSHTLRTLFSRTSPFFVKPSALPQTLDFLTRFARKCTAEGFRSGVARLDVLNRHTRRLYRDLKADGIATGVSETGILRVFAGRASAEADHAMVQALAERGLGPGPGPILGGSELQAFEPSLGPAARFGFVQREEAFANPSRVVDELIASLRACGLETQEGAQATDIIEDSGGVRIVTEAGEVRADKCLVAMGAWSRDFARRLGLRLAMAPGKGYSFAIAPQIMPKRAMAFVDAHAGATPLGEGLLRLAGTMEFDGTYDRLNPARIAAIRAAAEPFLAPADWSTATAQWVAPRPMTPDGAPYIGAVPGRSATFIATGHNMLGFSLGPATGTLVADMMAGTADPAALQALSPTRSL